MVLGNPSKMAAFLLVCGGRAETIGSSRCHVGIKIIWNGITPRSWEAIWTMKLA